VLAARRFSVSSRFSIRPRKKSFFWYGNEEEREDPAGPERERAGDRFVQVQEAEGESEGYRNGA